jgi:hypothetical protein
LSVVLKVPLDVPGLWPTLALFHDHVKRFRVLDIDVPDPNIVDTILLSMTYPGGISKGNPAPLLEELSIAIDDQPRPRRYDTEQPYPEPVFYPVARHWKITLSALSHPLPSSKSLLTITSLTITAGIDELYIEGMLDTIQAIPHLKSLKYSALDHCSYQSTHTTNLPRVVHLPNLKAADVTTPGCGLEILLCLVAPNLRFVRLDGERKIGYRGTWKDGAFSQVSTLIRRLPHRAPCLQRLDLHHIHCLKAKTYAWLLNQADFTHLEELRVESSNIADSAFIQPTLHGPRIRRIELKDCRHITGSGLMPYIKAKQRLGDEDFQLLVSGCLGVGDEDRAQMSCLGTSAEEV